VKKVYFMMMALFVLITAVPVSTAQAASVDASWLITSKVAQGVIGINYDIPKDKRIKLMITKDNSSYTYNLYASGQAEDFPLQQGNGTYKVSVLENTTGNKYKSLYSEVVDVTMSDSNSVYLGSVQNVKWSSSDKAILKAKELTKGKTTDEEKVKAIYNYVVANVQYDYSLANNVTTDYIPNINNTLNTKKGICYDYASLFAAMLRSVDVPAKLVMGNTSYVTQYHAWNEVLMDGKWVTIDTTVDASAAKSKKNADFIKASSKYTAAKYY
jgi:transglutaminase/protease-like cytokinesis protein 3